MMLRHLKHHRFSIKNGAIWEPSNKWIQWINQHFRLKICVFLTCRKIMFLKFLSSISLFLKIWNVVDIQYYVSFRCTTCWCDFRIHYEMMTILRLVTICPHMKLLQYYWSYSLHCIFTSPWPIFPTFLSWAQDVLPTSALDVTQKP